MEINCVANIKSMLESLLEEKELSGKAFSTLSKMAILTERYMLAHDRDKSVSWTDVVEHPEDYYTLAEFMERGF